MVNFRLICPDCDAVTITSSPEAMIWEHCPHCRNHVWDSCDVLMAEVVSKHVVAAKTLTGNQ
jgi:Zn-finger nucleic acid-binding protein